MSKYRKQLAIALEAMEENNNEQLEQSAQDVQDSFEEINELREGIEDAGDGAAQLEYIAECLKQDPNNKTALNIARYSAQSIYTRVGLSGKTIAALEDNNSNKIADSIKKTASAIFTKIIETIKKSIEMITSFFGKIKDYITKLKTKTDEIKKEAQTVKEEVTTFKDYDIKEWRLEYQEYMSVLFTDTNNTISPKTINESLDNLTKLMQFNSDILWRVAKDATEKIPESSENYGEYFGYYTRTIIKSIDRFYDGGLLGAKTGLNIIVFDHATNRLLVKPPMGGARVKNPIVHPFNSWKEFDEVIDNIDTVSKNIDAFIEHNENWKSIYDEALKMINKLNVENEQASKAHEFIRFLDQVTTALSVDFPALATKVNGAALRFCNDWLTKVKSEKTENKK